MYTDMFVQKNMVIKIIELGKIFSVFFSHFCAPELKKNYSRINIYYLAIKFGEKSVKNF